MPSTSSASISSRMVRAPRSAQMAVEPAPATTSTVTSGPSWVTAARAAPAPEMSAAPNSVSRMLRVKIRSTVKRNRDRERRQERDLEQEPALKDELPPLEVPAEERFGSEHAHPHKAADGLHRRPGLIGDVVADPRLRRRHQRAPMLRPSWRYGRPCRTPPPCTEPLSVTTVSLLTGSKADHRNVHDAAVGLHRIRRIDPLTVSKPISPS